MTTTKKQKPLTADELKARIFQMVEAWATQPGVQVDELFECRTETPTRVLRSFKISISAKK